MYENIYIKCCCQARYFDKDRREDWSLNFYDVWV